MRTTRLLLVPLALAGIACGDGLKLTTGEGDGTTGFAVLVTDDPSNDPPGPPAPAPGFDGDIEGAIRVSLRSDGGALVELGLAQDELIALQGGDTVTLSDLSRPPTDNYVAIVLRFEGVRATIAAGSEIGDTTITSDAVLEVGNGNAAVEIAVPTFDVDSESEMDIVVDLNSEFWITESNLADLAVPQADLVNNVTVEIP